MERGTVQQGTCQHQRGRGGSVLGARGRGVCKRMTRLDFAPGERGFHSSWGDAVARGHGGDPGRHPPQTSASRVRVSLGPAHGATTQTRSKLLRARKRAVIYCAKKNGVIPLIFWRRSKMLRDLPPPGARTPARVSTDGRRAHMQWLSANRQPSQRGLRGLLRSSRGRTAKRAPASRDLRRNDVEERASGSLGVRRGMGA